MPNRIDRGWKLYLAGAVEVEAIFDDQIYFDVVSSSRREIHKVAMIDDTWTCSCEDFHNRNKRESTKQLICMHIHASIFKLAEINGLADILKKKSKELNLPLKEYLEKLDSADNAVLNAIKEMEGAD